MKTFGILRRLTGCCILAGSLMLTACVSYQPAQMVPSITLSPEEVILPSPRRNDADGGVDFGLTVTANESDSLFNLEVLPGVRIRTVVPGGPADLAGLRAGDVILAVNGVDTNEPDALTVLARQTDSQVFSFRVRRDTTVLEAELMPRPATTAAVPVRELYRIDPLASRAGYETTLITIRSQGEVPAVRVVNLQPDSPLHDGDVRAGDIILALDGEPVSTAQGFINSLHRDYALGDAVQLSLYRDQQIIERRVNLWDPGRRVSRIGLRPLLFYESDIFNDQTRFSLLDFWLFAAYRFNRSGGERQHRILELFTVSSDYGELLEETPQP